MSEWSDSSRIALQLEHSDLGFRVYLCQVHFCSREIICSKESSTLWQVSRNSMARARSDYDFLIKLLLIGDSGMCWFSSDYVLARCLLLVFGRFLNLRLGRLFLLSLSSSHFELWLCLLNWLRVQVILSAIQTLNKHSEYELGNIHRNFRCGLECYILFAYDMHCTIIEKYNLATPRSSELIFC